MKYILLFTSLILSGVVYGDHHGVAAPSNDFTNVINFLANHHINKVKNENLLTNTDIFEYKRFVFENIDNYFIYNLSLKTLLNNLSNKINE